MTFLSKMISDIGADVNVSPNQYVLPTVQNLDSGSYLSEIKDIKEIVDTNGNLEALDFYHCLTDISGNILNVRFRYYEKELPLLAKNLQRYSHVKTWKDTVGLCENITVEPKKTGNYMRIVARDDSKIEFSATSVVHPTEASPNKRSGLSSRYNNKKDNKASFMRRESLISENEADYDDFEEFFDETTV